MRNIFFGNDRPVILYREFRFQPRLCEGYKDFSAWRFVFYGIVYKRGDKAFIPDRNVKVYKTKKVGDYRYNLKKTL